MGESTASGVSGDYVTAQVLYDTVTQYTYREMTKGAGDYRLGAVTSRVYAYYLSIECSFVSAATGRRGMYTYEHSPNLNFNTQNYDSPWAIAYSKAGTASPADEFIIWKLGSKTFYF